jgi:signal transduction histidine kinase
MTEVIYILLDNASKYAPAGTTITVRADLVDDHHVQVSVADEGPGIPADLRERVFERFFRVPAREPAVARQPGAGLGLPIARRLVDAQAGRIWIEPAAERRGTTVMVLLPVAVEANEPQPVVAAAV